MPLRRWPVLPSVRFRREAEVLFRCARWTPRCVALCAMLSVVSSVSAVQLDLRVVDTQGSPLPARVHIVDALGVSFPLEPDSTLLAYYGGPFMRSYFYVDGPKVVSLPPGPTEIVSVHGFEFLPRKLTPVLVNDTTITLTMFRGFDMEPHDLHSGDDHAHTRHEPRDYFISPVEAHRVAQAEGLNILWSLDEFHYFTGAPDPVSTPDAILYYTTEWRHQASGHVALLGLHQDEGYGCCTPPLSAAPLLSDFRAEWAPAADQAMVLNHPCTGADFYDDSGWPAWGLGRELPILASRAALDAYHIGSYANEDDIVLQDWYALLNCGFRIPASAGTDARLCSFFMRPAGGYRVYVKEPTGHSASNYVAGLRAGCTFVTNFPLIPMFRVDGLDAGSVGVLIGPSKVVDVDFRVESTLSVTSATLIVNGAAAAVYPLQAGANGTAQTIHTQLTLTSSSWVALRVDGSTNLPVAVRPELFAHTSPVYFTMDGAPQENTIEAGRMLDWIDEYENFCEVRGGWIDPAEHQSVLSGIEAGRPSYRAHFHVPPDPFLLALPLDGDTLSYGDGISFDWGDATDPEPGDKVTYAVTLAADSLFITGSTVLPSLFSELLLSDAGLQPNRNYWWRVAAYDRNRNQRLSIPNKRRFYLRLDPAAAPVPETRPAVTVSPNPATSAVTLRLARPLDVGEKLEIVNVRGERVAVAGWNGGAGLLARDSGTWTWDRRDHAGRDVPSGFYWVRVASENVVAPAQRILVLR